MLIEESDQVQDSEGTEPETTETPEENSETTGSEDNQENQNEEQSNKDEETQESEKMYDTPDGRKLTADQMYEEYGKLLPEFTRRSQALKKFEAQEAERRAKSEAEARRSTDDLLKNVPGDVKEVIVKVASDLFEQKAKEREEANRILEEERQRQEADNRFQTQLKDLSKKYDGKSSEFAGIPKFDPVEVVKAMKDPDNKIFDPEVKFMEMHRAKFLNLEIQKALKQQKGGNKTEATGRTPSSERGTTQSGGSTPKTIREASQAFLNRMASLNSE